MAERAQPDVENEATLHRDADELEDLHAEMVDLHKRMAQIENRIRNLEFPPSRNIMGSMEIATINGGADPFERWRLKFMDDGDVRWEKRYR